MKNLRYVIIAGIFGVLFIPLIVNNSLFFPFISGKGFAFRIIVEIMLGLWAILALTHSEYRPRKSLILWSLVGFVGIMALADAFSINPMKSFWSNYERMEGWITLAHLLAYFVITATVLNTERLWKWFWNTSIGVSLIMVIIGIFQLAGVVTINQGGVRLDARFGNATYLAVYMLFHIFITAYLIVSNRMFLGVPGNGNKKYQKLIIGGIIIILQTVILYNTATRGAMLGLIGGIGLSALLIAIFGGKHRRLQKISFAMIAGVVLLVVGFLMIKNAQFVRQSPVLSRFASISLDDNTTKSRFILWGMAIEGFKERPILGWGQESFNYIFNKYYDPRLYNQEQWFDRTHNVIFDWLIAGGILGILSYLSFYAGIIYCIWRGREENFTIPEKALLTGLLFGYFIHNLFVFDNLISYIMFISLGAYVYSHTTRNQIAISRKIENKAIIPVAALVTIMLLWGVNSKPYKQNAELINALTPRQNAAQPTMNGQVPYNGDVTENLAAFKKAIAYDSIGTPEGREQVLSLAEQFVSVQAPITGRDEFMAYALEQGKAQIERTPNDARYQALYGMFLSHAGAYQQSLEYLKKAVELSPKKQSIMFELGAAYLGVKQYPEAFDVLKRAYELEPKNLQAKILYAAAAVYMNNQALVTELLKDLPASDVVNNNFLLQSYFASGNQQMVLNIWKERVKLDPQDPQKRLSLAAAYLYVKDTKNAILEIQETIKIYPAFKEQGEAIIKDIRAGKNVLQ